MIIPAGPPARVVTDLPAWLAGLGFSVDSLTIDGAIHRVSHACKSGAKTNDAGWYWAVDDGEIPVAVCGCWRCGVRHQWLGVSRELTREERTKIDEVCRRREEEDKARQLNVASDVERSIQELPLAGNDHPYLIAKGIQPHGALVAKEALIIPLMDIHGKVWSAQGIAVEAVPQLNGKTKSYEPGGRVFGCMYPIGPVRGAPLVIICEGYATGATIYEATGIPVACAMSAGNLKPVAQAFRNEYPETDLLIAADNDSGTDGNPGVTKANEAALVCGCAVAVPTFKEPKPGKTDFNDLQAAEGAAAVAEIINGVKPTSRVRLYYETKASSGCWWILAADKTYIPINESGAGRALRISGISSVTKKGDNSSPLEREMHRILTEQNVHYAGHLAGWSAGIHSMNGRKILVTESHSILPRGPGECNAMLEILEKMLGVDQMKRLLLWMHCARRRLVAPPRHPLPVIILVGPKSCGKSLLQYIITQLLGGRSANPIKYMLGDTPFNSELFGAEHLVIEDETSKTDSASRMRLGEQFKSMLYVRRQKCHGKHQVAIDIDPVWAMSMSLNDQEEHLLVLPRIDDSLRDKMLLLSCEAHPRNVPEGRNENEWLTEVLALELPAFADLVDRFSPEVAPKEIQDPRSVVAGWQHPRILGQLNSMSPEVRLLGLIDDTLFDSPCPSAWKGTADQLSKALRQGAAAREAEKLLSWNTACGVYLSRLADSHPERVLRDGREATDEGKVRTWVIKPAK